MLDALMEFASYMPHGYCLLWEPWLVLLYVGSDALIVLSYFAIPVALGLFVHQRRDLRYRGLVALFASFILLCGVTHAFSILILWLPVYPLHGAVKLLTGIVSLATAVVLFRLIPTLVRIPSPAQLEAANAELRAEIASHERTMDELRAIRQSLEEQVAQRTAELSAANAHLAVVSQEAVHRSRNLIAMVNSIARQTARSTKDLPEFTGKLFGRLDALANATATVLGRDQAGTAPMAAVAADQLAPLTETYPGRVDMAGPDVALSAEQARHVCLALHELATNAVKYGALAAPAGRIALQWSLSRRDDADWLELEWRETGAPEGDDEKTGGGFGSALLTGAVPDMLQGVAERRFVPGGLIYTLRFPV